MGQCHLNLEIIPLVLSVQVQVHAGHSPSGVTVSVTVSLGSARAEFGTSTSNFEQLDFIGKKCRTDPYAFLLQFCKSSSSLCFYEVMENKRLFVLGPMDYFL